MVGPPKEIPGAPREGAGADHLRRLGGGGERGDVLGVAAVAGQPVPAHRQFLGQNSWTGQGYARWVCRDRAPACLVWPNKQSRLCRLVSLRPDWRHGDRQIDREDGAMRTLHDLNSFHLD